MLSHDTKIQPTDLKLLVSHKSTVNLLTDLETVAALLEHSDAGFYAVLEGPVPVGLIAREALLQMISAAPREVQGRDAVDRAPNKLLLSSLMFWKSPPKPVVAVEQTARVGEAMHADPLIIEHGTAPDAVFDAVFERPDSRLGEDVILTDANGHYLGNIRATAVLRLLHGFLGKHIRDLRVQKESWAFRHSEVAKVRRDLELTNKKLELSRDQALEGVRMKSAFLSNMSHEIRTPMSGVFGMIDLLNDTELNEDQEQFVSTARSSAQTLMELINHILEFSNLEAEKVSVEEAPFDLVEIVESSAALYHEAAYEKKIELVIHFDDVWQRVVGDPHRYQQILNNLLSNAIKFTDRGCVEILLKPEGSGAELGILTMVRDTGIGISPREVTKLFDPKARAGDSGACPSSDSGLGLSICQNLCDSLGGSIACTSQEHEGSVFSVFLPLPPHESAEGAKRVRQRVVCNASWKPSRKDFAYLRVLLVEDNQVNQEVARRFLHKLKCEVVVADNGAIALECLREGNFDCVLMDCQMPVMDGYAATAAIRMGGAGEQCRDIFISAMTAHALSGDQEKCLQAGMDYYFTKPFVLQDFRQALELALQKSELALGGRGLERSRRVASRDVSG